MQVFSLFEQHYLFNLYFYQSPPLQTIIMFILFNPNNSQLSSSGHPYQLLLAIFKVLINLIFLLLYICILYFFEQLMSCKDSFSLFDFGSNFNTLCPPLPINDELMSFVSEQQQITPQTNFDILLNKHLNNLEITDIELQQLPEHQRNVLYQIQNKGKDKKKRVDQSQKLFYKRAFKYSEGKFFKRCKNKSRKMSHFYHYHFDSISQIEGVPITQFYHPNKKTKPGLTIGHKTFNSKYVRLLLKSKSFLQDTREYHKIFIDDCLRERKKKVISFTNSIQRILNRAQEDSRILVKHLQSSQFKIPWTYNEIKETWEIAQRDLEEIPQPDQKKQSFREIQEQISLGSNILSDQMI